MDDDKQQLYWTFKDEHPCWPLIASAISLCIVATLGITFNSALIYVTIRTKSLRATSNFLLGLTCFFELLHQHGHFLFLFIALSGINFIEFHLAIKICAVSLFGLGGTAPSMTFTALDRLICVLFPSLQITKKWLYLSAYTALCIVAGLLQTIMAYDTENQIGTLMTTGTLGDLLSTQNPLGQHFNVTTLVFNCTTIFIYIVIGISLQMRKAKVSPSNAVESTNRRVFRSIAIIIVINISGYFILNIFRMFVGKTIAGPIWKWFARQILAVLANLSSATNGPILYITSEDYRHAMRKEFAWVWKIAGKESAPNVIHVPPNH